MNSPINLKWKKLNPQAELPKVQSAGAACFDLKAIFEGSELILKPGEINLVPTGLAVEIPLGYEMQVRARSGLSAKNGLILVNGIGTIDADYRGEIKVIAMILGKEPLVVKNGDRIAQALISPVLTVTHTEVQELGSTERGLGGFGSTGVSS